MSVTPAGVVRYQWVSDLGIWRYYREQQGHTGRQVYCGIVGPRTGGGYMLRVLLGDWIDLPTATLEEAKMVVESIVALDGG